MGLPEIPPQEDSAPEDWVRREMEQRGIYNPLPGQEQEYIDWQHAKAPTQITIPAPTTAATIPQAKTTTPQAQRSFPQIFPTTAHLQVVPL